MRRKDGNPEQDGAMQTEHTFHAETIYLKVGLWYNMVRGNFEVFRTDNKKDSFIRHKSVLFNQKIGKDENV